MRKLLFALYFVFPFSMDAAARTGDVNGDSQVTVLDVMYMVDYLLGMPDSSFIKANADVDGNNEISLSDLMMIVDMILMPEEEMGPGSAEDPDVGGK